VEASVCIKIKHLPQTDSVCQTTFCGLVPSFSLPSSPPDTVRFCQTQTLLQTQAAPDTAKRLDCVHVMRSLCDCQVYCLTSSSSRNYRDNPHRLPASPNASFPALQVANPSAEGKEYRTHIISSENREMESQKLKGNNAQDPLQTVH